jgi:hypothetical protein
MEGSYQISASLSHRFAIQDVIEAFNTNIYTKSGAVIRLSMITNKDQVVGGAVGACASIPF